MSEKTASNPVTAEVHLERKSIWRTWFSLAVVAVIFGVVFIFPFNSSSAGATTASFVRTERLVEPVAAGQDSGSDFSHFGHDRTHGSLPCLLCHRRESNSPRPSVPGHTPCAGCHAQKFADSSSPICTVCHTGVATASLKPFPNMKSFGIRFEHTQHIRGQGLACVTCHKPRRNGVALSIPSSFEAHSTCYECHTNRASAAGKDISSCGTCHVPGSYARVSESSRAYQVSFSHARNTSKGLNCVGCHNVRSGLAISRQVTTPQPLQHHASAQAQSCMSCHNGKRTFGGDDFTSCKRCHLSDRFSWGRGR